MPKVFSNNMIKTNFDSLPNSFFIDNRKLKKLKRKGLVYEKELMIYNPFDNFAFLFVKVATEETYFILKKWGRKKHWEYLKKGQPIVSISRLATCYKIFSSRAELAKFKLGE